jgi:hypothetical protein
VNSAPFKRWISDLRQKPIVLGALLVLATLLYETAEQEFAAALQIDPNDSTALLLRRQASDQAGSGSR